jgi:hypothetical protein
MLKALSINKKNSCAKNALASNNSVIIEEVIVDKNKRMLSKNDIDLADKTINNNFSPKNLRSIDQKNYFLLIFITFLCVITFQPYMHTVKLWNLMRTRNSIRFN